MGVPVTLPFNLTNGTTADATQVMADFNAIVSTLATSAAASGANSDITSLTGITTPLTPGRGGTSTFSGGTSSGSAAAQVVTPTTPTNFTLTANYSIVFTAGFSSTGATTLNVNSTGAKNLLKQTAAGLSALGTNDIRVGQIVVATFDGTQFQLINVINPLTLVNANSVVGNPTGGAAAAQSLAIGGGLSFSGSTLVSSAFVPNVQIFLSGSAATYTTPTNGGALPLYLRIRMVGGGGGGGASSTNNGGNGGDTNFGSWTAIHGAGGVAGGAGGSGGSGGVNSTGSLITRVNGATGSALGNPAAATFPGGAGGSSMFGGAGPATSGGTGGAAQANTGSGGGGGAATTGVGSGGGGGAGEFAEFIISSPAASYTYTVGTQGNGGVAGGNAGGNGAAGRIEVIAYWQ